MKELIQRTLVGVLAIGFTSTSLAADAVVASVVAPSVLVLKSKTASPVTVHAEVGFSLVLAGSVRLNGIPAVSIFADSRGELVAKFPISAIKDLGEAVLEDPAAAPELTLTLTAELKDGREIVGTDVVPVR